MDHSSVLVVSRPTLRITELNNQNCNKLVLIFIIPTASSARPTALFLELKDST